jgi:hypothetical protein
VIDVSRHDDTAEVIGSNDPVASPPAEEPVGRVNLPDEPDDDPVAGAVAAGAMQHQAEMTLPSGNLREKVLFGLLAGVMMVLALVVILQGVFEQKMPI